MSTKKILLTKREQTTCLKKHSGWTINAKATQLARTFSFDDHVTALVFIARVTVHAQVLNHHPDITFTYQKVKVKLTTHELNGLTKLDLALLERIESAYQKSA